MCIYIYIERERYGVTTNFMCSFGRGIFWALLLTRFYLPESARAYLFPQIIKMHYFRSGPISVDERLVECCWNGTV